MSEHYATTDLPPAGAQPQRLSERLASLAPPSVAATLAAQAGQHANPPLPRPSPRVAAALARSQARADRIARRAERSFYARSLPVRIVESFVSACSFIPYALAALGLRLVIANVFFFAGQTMIDGPRIPVSIHDFNLSVILPLQVKADTFTAFLTTYSAVPVPPVLAAYLVSYASFLLPLCLVLGFATRFAAVGLLVMTAMIQLYVLPQALWSTHVYWAAILLVLISRGAGEISIDHIIRYIARR